MQKNKKNNNNNKPNKQNQKFLNLVHNQDSDTKNFQLAWAKCDKQDDFGDVILEALGIHKGENKCNTMNPLYSAMGSAVKGLVILDRAQEMIRKSSDSRVS